jgi:thiol-disulfide isomerase/thioredoxin
MSFKNWAILLLCVGIFAYWKLKVQRPAPGEIANTPAYHELITTESCAGKKSCVLIYVTPWCPACEQMSPFIQKWLAKAKDDPDYGFKVIVGMENARGDNQRLAKRYAPVSVIDHRRKIHDLLGVRYYPTLLMVKTSGEVDARDDKVIEWAMNRYNTGP